MQCSTCGEHFLEPISGSCPFCGVVLEDSPFDQFPEHSALNRVPDERSNTSAATDKVTGERNQEAPRFSGDTARGRPGKDHQIVPYAAEEKGPDGRDSPLTEPHEQWVERCVQRATKEIPGLAELSRRQIQDAIQVRLAHGNQKCPVTFYVTGTVWVGGSPTTPLHQQLKQLSWPERAVTRPRASPVNRTYYILDVSSESLRRALGRVKDLSIREQEPVVFSTVNWELIRGQDRLRLQAYRTEKVTLQGRRSEFAGEVERLLEEEMVRSHQEYRNRPLPKPVPQEELREAASFVERKVGETAWGMLRQERRCALAFCWRQLCHPPEGVNDYSFLISSVVPSLEQFLIALAQRVNIGQPLDERGRSRIGEWLNKLRDTAVRTRDEKTRQMAERLRSAWDERNAFTHPGPTSSKPRGASDCREQLLKWLEVMRDAARWMEEGARA